MKPIKHFSKSHISISVGRLLSTRYRDYARYVVYRRAIPSFVDGLKPVQRKAIWTALHHAKKKKIKTAALSGYVIAQSNYHHGDASISSAITSMAAEWSNNLPLFDSEGNFGSRAIHEAGAPRYTFVKLSKVFEEWFKDEDIAPKSDDPEDPEPRFYLPVIPWVLVNGVSGIAIGFATEILPRSPTKIAKYVHNLLTNYVEDYDLLRPHFPGFRGTVKRDASAPNRWITYGTYERVKRGCVRVTEIPWGVDRAGYIKKLEALIEKGTIKSYTDLGQLRFDIRAPGIDKWSKEKTIRTLKLQSSMTENIVVINHEDDLIQYDSAQELIDDWLELRLHYYGERINKRIIDLTDEIEKQEAIYQFILTVLAGEIEFIGQPRTRLIESIIEAEPTFEKYIDILLKVNVSRFCDDEVERMQVKISDLKEQLEWWERTKPESLHADELSKTFMKGN